MPLLNITPCQMDIQLSRTLCRMSQDLLQDGRGATGLYPECPSRVAEEVGGEVEESVRRERKSQTSEEIRLPL